MSVHDWTRVEAGIFHHFHHAWISAISDVLNGGLLPKDYYALAEQYAGGFEPDVLALQLRPDWGSSNGGPEFAPSDGGTALLLAPPKVPMTAESEMEFYHRKQNSVVIRHVSGDSLVAVVEIVSPGNKHGQQALYAFIDKATSLIRHGVHLLVLDLFPPGRRDPQGIHGVIWESVSGKDYSAPPGKPLTLVAYESATAVRAYVQAIAVGDRLPDMPLFLQPGGHIDVPLETAYQSAFHAVPARWRHVLENQ